MAETVRRLQVGDRAPEPEVRGQEGPVGLGLAWAEGSAVVIFLRHFG